MTGITRIFRSSIGKKFLMAVSGLILVAFVAGHLGGNLLIFLGPHALNGYAHHLRDIPPLLWTARVVLLAALVIHVVTSAQLTRQNRAARPVTYKAYRPSETTWYARTMLISGVALLAYIVFHLLHFTFEIFEHEGAELIEDIDAFGHHDVYRLVVTSFHEPWMTFLYIVAMALVFSHLRHGIASAPQSLGINNERTITVFERAGATLAWVFFLGYSSIPLSIVFGVIQ